MFKMYVVRKSQGYIYVCNLNKLMHSITHVAYSCMIVNTSSIVILYEFKSYYRLLEHLIIYR